MGFNCEDVWFEYIKCIENKVTAVKKNRPIHVEQTSVIEKFFSRLTHIL